jgi:hypothetical protein
VRSRGDLEKTQVSEYNRDLWEIGEGEMGGIERFVDAKWRSGGNRERLGKDV